MLTQCQVGKTSAMTSEKQLLGIWEELSELSEVHNPAARKILPRRKTSLPIFPGVDVPADSAQGQSVKLREMTENPRAPSQTLQASVSRLKVMTGQSEKPLNQYGCLEGLTEKASSH
ncbi:hypothetical protein XENORESO_015733 [Xenotaenia resolanae]|uniref:Uncharacterized protein n=1 Tax=Xenotaenia resolanae TaxID=208358 RepID=A0ABV0X4Z9_9TELE